MWNAVNFTNIQQNANQNKTLLYVNQFGKKKKIWDIYQMLMKREYKL